jgi:regulator of sirC expression with transglutaminase-like and TPR domain
LDSKEIKALVSLLDDPDREVFDHVKDKILSMGNEMIALLEKEWSKNLNPLVQNRIESLIYELQVEERTKRFMEWKNSYEQDLLKGLWLVSTIQYPEYELSELKREIEMLFLEVWQKYDINTKGRDTIAELNNILFQELKFSANTKNFHSPENSMLKSVLATKKGNPISLAMIYMILANKLKLPVFGVNLPNLFVLTYMDDQEQFYINVFNKGLIFTRTDIENYVDQLNLKRQDSFFSPCNNLEIIKRFLRNLIVSYDKNGQQDKKEEARNILLFLSDSP